MSNTIHQEVELTASPEHVLELLTSSEQFAAATGAAAKIDPQSGGAFTAFDGMITGRHIETLPDKLLVQAWRVANWEPGIYSIVRFELHPTENGTRLVFDHTGFPEQEIKHLAAGWPIKYWEPMQRYFK